MATIRIKQVRSRISIPERQKRTLDALGLRKIGRVVEHEATPSILGMVEKVKYLVELEVVESSIYLTDNQQKQEDVDKLFDLKIQLTNEYLRNEGIKKINDKALLEDIINFNRYDKKTHTSRLKTFMNVIFYDNCQPPLVQKNIMDEYCSFIQKKLFFDQIKIDTEEQIDELFEKYKDTKDFIFRGQREASWRLYSTIQRKWILGNHERIKDFPIVLKKMVEIGKQKYESEIKTIVGKEHIDVVNDLAVLGFLQHHGCPTPLLDWTSSFINALFFAIDGVEQNTIVKAIQDYVSVYYLHPDDIELGGAASIIDYALKTEGQSLKSTLISIMAKDTKQKKEMEKHFKDRDIFDRTKIAGSGLISNWCTIENMISFQQQIMYYHDNDAFEGIVFSLLNSDNIKKQQGAFVWNSSSYKPLEVMAVEYFDTYERTSKTESYRFCDCYNINKKLVPYIQSKLQVLGINKDSIYPDTGINASSIFDIAVKGFDRSLLYN
jgi:ribosomal protein L30